MNRDDQPKDVPQRNDMSPDSVPPTRPATRNPWEDDDEHQQTAPDDPDRALTMRLLRPSLIALVVCTGLIFLTAVASSTAPANSPMEQTALVLHRFGMFGMLVSFFGILISYRLPGIVKSMQNDQSPETSKGKRRKSSLLSGLRGLLIFNLILIVMTWLIEISSQIIPLSLLQLAALVSIGVLGNFAILHRGLLQAYAIGVLLPLAVVLINWQSMLVESFGVYNILAVQLTAVLIAGMISAALYTFNANVKAMRTEKQATDANP